MTGRELIQELFERFSRGDIDAVLDLMADDVVIVVPASMSAEPDVYQGHEGALRYLRGFDGTIEDVRFEPEGYVEENGLLIVQMVLSGRGVTSGIEVSIPAWCVTWVAGGRIKRLEPLPDLETARERARAAG